jgi:hypothetical protein
VISGISLRRVSYRPAAYAAESNATIRPMNAAQPPRPTLSTSHRTVTFSGAASGAAFSGCVTLTLSHGGAVFVKVAYQESKFRQRVPQITHKGLLILLGSGVVHRAIVPRV